MQWIFPPLRMVKQLLVVMPFQEWPAALHQLHNQSLFPLNAIVAYIHIWHSASQRRWLWAATWDSACKL